MGSLKGDWIIKRASWKGNAKVTHDSKLKVQLGGDNKYKVKWKNGSNTDRTYDTNNTSVPSSPLQFSGTEGGESYWVRMTLVEMGGQDFIVGIFADSAPAFVNEGPLAANDADLFIAVRTEPEPV